MANLSDSIKSVLNELPLADKIREVIRSNGYQIKENDTWIQGEIDTKSGSSCSKFHISVDRNDKNRWNALKVVLEILFKHEISTFKVTNPEWMVSEGSNLDGKEICVYFSAIELNKMELVAREVNEALKEAQIESGTPSKADVPFLGDGFIYTRSTETSYEIYLGADKLEQFRFTRSEAALIGKEYNPLLKSLPSPFNFIEFDLVEEEESDCSRDILDHYLIDLFGKQEDVAMRVGLFWLLRGDPIRSFMFNENHTNLLKVICLDFLGQYNNGDLNPHNPIGELFDTCLFQEPLFNDILRCASIQLSALYKKRGIPQTTIPGNIVPAFYYGVLLLLYQNLNEDDDITKEKVLEILEKPENKESIIRHFVSAGLRDREQIQIDSDQPKLLG